MQCYLWPFVQMMNCAFKLISSSELDQNTGLCKKLCLKSIWHHEAMRQLYN